VKRVGLAKPPGTLLKSGDPAKILADLAGHQDIPFMLLRHISCHGQ